MSSTVNEVNSVKELLNAQFGGKWRGSLQELDSIKSLVDWLFGYPLHSSKLSPLEHEIEFGN
jgi:hypothetical protein